MPKSVKPRCTHGAEQRSLFGQRRNLTTMLSRVHQMEGALVWCVFSVNAASLTKRRSCLNFDLGDSTGHHIGFDSSFGSRRWPEARFFALFHRRFPGAFVICKFCYVPHLQILLRSAFVDVHNLFLAQVVCQKGVASMQYEFQLLSKFRVRSGDSHWFHIFLCMSTRYYCSHDISFFCGYF